MVNTKTTLDTSDLDEDEIQALAEVAKKGYYHARPKTESAPPPQRIENPEALSAEAGTSIKKRSTFDSYQQKWDRFEKEEPQVEIVDGSKPKVKPASQQPGWNLMSCCRRKK
eukprot:TRINITY_DN96235_c0_g1_i1.p1 TRINITY_DN96235_c0_g1~~TRINITY_DN96235_c0_g1_i1.p1  ORF type:complete len:120 (+),score=25.47 TRINITY_DN96235_c0_g1_i1:26-361(+)